MYMIINFFKQPIINIEICVNYSEKKVYNKNKDPFYI